MAKNIDTVVFSCVIEVKGTSVMDEKLILKIIDLSITDDSSSTLHMIFYFIFLLTFLTTQVSFPCCQDRDAEKSDWLASFQCKTLQNILTSWQTSCRFLSHSPPPPLPLSVPLAQGLAVLAEALCCKSGSACPVINRSELHRSAVQMQVTASCSTSMPRSVLIEQIHFCSPLFDPCSVWSWSILSNSFCFTCNKCGNLTGEIQGIVVYRWAMCVLCR